jgi:hypothetical protein
MLWAFFWFLSLVLGLVLYLIAHSGGVRNAQRNQPFLGAPGSSPRPPQSTRRPPGPAPSPSASDLFPAYPRPANAQSPTSPESDDELGDTEGGEEPAATDVDDGSGSWVSSPPAWHPDPSGRFHYRWWDGTEWTSQVSTDGHHLIDTNPDQRIGPY